MPVIFTNPSGAPELACDECGCRWFDRMSGACTCYECGAPVSDEAQAEFERAVQAHAARRAARDAPRHRAAGRSPARGD
ncbi:MAG: hypothetical protein U1F67_10815 [Rubrivivax sp.]